MNGILPLWKEKGMTSHDCVFKLRKILKTKKVGHTGTLDPNVEGVLPICVGQATKVAEYITNAGKEYEAVISIGKTTETEDADGAVVKCDDTEKQITKSEIEKALHNLTGEITQIPPMYSAVRVKGRRLYEYAREGIEVERSERKVTIHKLELLEPKELYEGREIRFNVRIACSKGTYIRTLAVQMGELLGYPAHMKSLIRTVSGAYREKDCKTLAQIAELCEQGKAMECIHPLEDALIDFPSVEVDEDMYTKIVHAQVLPVHPLMKNDIPIVFTKNHKAIAVYQHHPTKKGLMKPEKMFPLNK